VATDGEGNVYLTGLVPYGPATETGQPVAMVLEKSDPSGDRLWTARWESPSRRFPDAAGRGVAVTPDGSVVYVAGAVMLPPWEAEQPRLWAYTADGQLLWSIRTRMSLDVAASAAGALVGGTGWLGAYGPDGDRLWAEPFEEPDGAHCDVVRDVAIGDDGDVVAVGFLDTTPTCGSIEGGAYEDADVVIQRRTSSGALVWSRILTDPGVTDNDWPAAADVAGRRIFVVGEADGSPWLARVSPRGEIVWERSWGGTAMPVGVSVANWGGVYVADQGALRRYTPGGDLVWERRLRRVADEAASGVATAPGGIVYVTADVFAESGDLWRVPP
jgi:hypothetical protein